MIHLKDVTFRYSNTTENTINNFSLNISAGECVLLCGQSGCGKTTITRLINGLIPHYYEGELTGEVKVAGLNVTKSELYDISTRVGSVFQNPRSQFFCVDTTSEIAFGCENMGLPKEEIKERVLSASEDMNVTELLGRSIFNLSGGEKQKIAFASVLAMGPDIFVLDEPTSNLEVHSIESLKMAIKTLKDAGKTIVIAEHRLYWLRNLCDRVIYMEKGRIINDSSMDEFISYTSNNPSNIGLRTLSLESITINQSRPTANETIILQNYKYTYPNSNLHALDIKESVLPKGGIIAVIGYNGAGKSTLSKCLCGIISKSKGSCTYDGHCHSIKQMSKNSYMVMQDVNHQLFCETVEEEIRLGSNILNEETITEIMKAMSIYSLKDRHPLSLSGGQKQRVAIASAILTKSDILVFDEPTSGLDYIHMKKTAALINSLDDEQTLFVVTHDLELISLCCNYVMEMEKGHIKDQYILDEEGKNKLLHFFIKKKAK